MEELKALIALAALAQGTRLQLFRLLVIRGPTGMSAGTIAEHLAVPPSSLSFHLQQLTHAGLVSQRRLGRQVIYSAEYGVMTALLAYLSDNCYRQGAARAPACNPVASGIAASAKSDAA